MISMGDVKDLFVGGAVVFVGCSVVALLVVAVLQFGGCGAAGQVGDYYEAVEEVGELLRESPDHLPARAEALVEAGDAEGIFAFVRDEIALTPTAYGQFQGVGDHVRWGARGALRSGQGTFREKADILAWLLEDAGYEAEVVGYYRPDGFTDSVWEAFFREVEREADLGISDDEAEALASRLKTSDSREWVEPREGLHGEELEEWLWDEAQELAETLLELGGEPGRATRYRILRNVRVPLVRVKIDGEDRYLNPGFVDASFDGEEVEGLEPAGEATGMLGIEAELQVLVAGGDPRWRTVAEGEWTADELVGRQLVIGSTAAASPATMSMMRIGDLDVLTPFMMVRGADVSQELAEELSVFGEPVSVDGQFVEFDEESGVVTRGGVELLASENADPSSVAEVQVVADGRRYPDVDLRVNLLDAEGESVLGFGAPNFVIEDEGEAVNGRLLQNAGARPRVLFLLDTSGSIPTEFRGAPMVEFADVLGREILEEFPGAQLGVVRVHNQAYRSMMTAENVWTRDLEEFRERGDAAIASNGGSALWENLAESSRLEPTVIVFINDGRDTGNDSEEVRAQVEMGAPALIVGVGPIIEEELQEMAERSGGEYFDAMTVEEIRGPLFEHLRGVASLPYRLRYRASGAGPESGEREVTVSIVDGRAEGSDTYEVPESPAPSPALAGIRLNITVGDVSVSRVLAGTGDLREARLPSERIRNDVLSTFVSPTTVFFEGDAPPLSVWLDEYVQALRTQEGFVREGVVGDGQSLLSAMDDGFEYLPAEAFVANSALPGALSGEARTFVQGMRVSILRERVEFETGLRRTSFDILPTAQFATMQRVHVDGDADGPSDYAVTLQRTAWLAMMEAATFSALGAPADEGVRGMATWNLLEGRELEYGSPARRPRPASVFAESTTEEREEWAPFLEPWTNEWKFFVPTDKEPKAMWVAHRATGELYGIMPDGTGGADTYERVTETLNKIDRLFRMYSLYTMPLNLSPAFGLLQSYFIMLAQMYAAVTMTLATMDASGLDDAMKAAVAGMVCRTMQTVAFMPFKAASSFITVIDGLLAIGSDHSVPMPCSFL